MSLEVVMGGEVVEIPKPRESAFHFPGTEKGWVEPTPAFYRSLHWHRLWPSPSEDHHDSSNSLEGFDSETPSEEMRRCECKMSIFKATEVVFPHVRTPFNLSSF